MEEMKNYEDAAKANLEVAERLRKALMAGEVDSEAVEEAKEIGKESDKFLKAAIKQLNKMKRGEIPVKPIPYLQPHPKK